MNRPIWVKLIVMLGSAAGLWLVLSTIMPLKTTAQQTCVQRCTPAQVVSPDHPIELERILADARRRGLTVSLQGSGYSQGGQSCAEGGIQINIREMNQIIHVDLEQREVTVQAGITWKRLQERLSVFGLSVAAMQSYADFTLGGSIGVNAHGQDVHWNPLAKSIVSLGVLLTDGRRLVASRETNPDLFRAIIGSYGLVGIVTEVTLKVLPNTLLEKKTQLVKTEHYQHYLAQVRDNPNLTLHSARLSINPLNLFGRMVVVDFVDTKQLATPEDEASPPQYPDASYLNLLKRSWLARVARTTFEYFGLEKDGRMTRNQAMGESVSSLANTVADTKDILQEYFIPPDQLDSFLAQLKPWVQRHHHFTLVNASVRWVNGDQDALMPYAPGNRLAVVLFINLPNTQEAEQSMQTATRELIDTTLELGGRYYLPYALYASKTQLLQAYPEIEQLLAAKRTWDPAGLLSNQFYRHYFLP